MARLHWNDTEVQRGVGVVGWARESGIMRAIKKSEIPHGIPVPPCPALNSWLRANEVNVMVLVKGQYTCPDKAKCLPQKSKVS